MGGAQLPVVRPEQVSRLRSADRSMFLWVYPSFFYFRRLK
jgi:hypothetical protein